MKIRAVMLAGALAMGLCGLQPAVAQSGGDSAPPKQLVDLQKSLHRQIGNVAVPAAHAVLHLGNDYYFVGADDARKILVQAWGNPPEQADGVLGLVFRKGTTIYDNVWAAVVTYHDSGYVSDADAKSEDYTSVLTQMKDDAESQNAMRTQKGYPQVHLVGWAQAPTYRPDSHSLIWAREIEFVGDAEHSLNYDVRMLGRNGVLSLNMLSSMGHLGDVGAAAGLGQSATFDSGYTYADYKPGVDKSAGYGLAGLVGGGLAVAAAKKIGLLGIILAFGKKFIVLIIAAFGGITAAVRRMFGRRNEEDEDEGTI